MRRALARIPARCALRGWLASLSTESLPQLPLLQPASTLLATVAAVAPRAEAPQSTEIGRPVRCPDPRSVAFLAARGCGTEQAVRTLLKGFAYHGETTEAAYAWLEERLSRCQPKTALRQGVQVSLLVSILTRAPFLLLRPPESLQRKWDMLLEVGISEVEALAMLRTFPATLGYSKYRYLSHAALLEELGVESGLSVIVRFPPMLGLGPEVLRDKFQLLSQFGLDASLSFSRFPGLLGVSDELLRIKLRYYTTVLRMEPDLLGVRAPGILGLSLQQRVRPRVAALLYVSSAAGMELPNSTSLATLLKLSDSDFVRRGLLAKRYLGCASDLATVPQFKAFASAPETVARLEAWEDRQRGLGC